MSSNRVYNDDAIDENILDNDQDEDDEYDDEENNLPTSQPDEDVDNNGGDDEDEEMEDDDDNGDDNDNEDNDNDNENDNEDDGEDDNENEDNDDDNENENENDEENSKSKSQKEVGGSNNNAEAEPDSEQSSKQQRLEQVKKLLAEDLEDENDQLNGKRKSEDVESNGDTAKKVKPANTDKSTIDTTKPTGKEKESVAAQDPPSENTEPVLSPEKIRENLILQSRVAEKFEIIPSVAIPYSSQVHSLALSRGCKWLFTGGEDGFIRKYDFIASFEGQTPLTVAQRHSLVDSVTNAGVILSYWENEQPVKKSSLKLKKSAANNANETYDPTLSPVYSLVVQSEALWLVSGLRSGGITLQSVRHHEGAIQAYLKKHTDTISSLRLNNEEDRLLSGAWDKKIYEWDLNTGKVVNDYPGIIGQVSNIEYRPMSSLDINSLKFSGDEEDEDNKSDIIKDDDYDSLFGSDDDEDQPNGASKSESNKNGDASAKEKKDQPASERLKLESADGSVNISQMNTNATASAAASKKSLQNENMYSNPAFDSNIFMSSTINGMINVWDRRTNKSVIEFKVPRNTPPWCMSTSWSIDGERIYAGRRNSTVEEFDIKMPYDNFLSREPKVAKLMKFPSLSGPVYTVKALPNNRHVLCGSNDNVRLYDLALHSGSGAKTKSSMVPFEIIPGHHGGVLSNIYVDPTCRFMISASGDRGWQGTSTETVLMYEIKTHMK